MKEDITEVVHQAFGKSDVILSWRELMWEGFNDLHHQWRCWWWGCLCHSWSHLKSQTISWDNHSTRLQTWLLLWSFQWISKVIRSSFKSIFSKQNVCDPHLFVLSMTFLIDRHWFESKSQNDLLFSFYQQNMQLLDLCFRQAVRAGLFVKMESWEQLDWKYT